MNYLVYAIILFVVAWIFSGALLSLLTKLLSKKDKELEEKQKELQNKLDKQEKDVLDKENGRVIVKDLTPEEIEEYWGKNQK